MDDINRQTPFKFSADQPYPEIKVCNKNARYVPMIIGNFAGPRSEMTAITQYLYYSLVAESDDETASVMLGISKVEMHHLYIFGSLVRQLGADPRLWNISNGRRRWWSPGYNKYPNNIKLMIKNAIDDEQLTVKTYTKQIELIADQNIKDILERIIIDEQLHIDILKQMYSKY